jgi:hypothetical protein
MNLKSKVSCEANSITPSTGASSRLNKNLLSEANKHKAFWASMRQTLSLCHRSPQVPDFQINAIEQELRHILDSRILIYPPTLMEYGIDKDTSYEDKKDLLHVQQPNTGLTENEIKFIKSMQNKTYESRKHNWRWRISEEMQEKADAGWYPFFVTLTVDPLHHDSEKLWKEGRAIRRYIRKLARISAQCVGHPPPHKKTKDWPYRPESDYITYAGVVEHGKSRVHHHGHFMIWMRAIPEKWKQCPNRYIHDPSKRDRNECIQMRRYWKYSLPGLSKANYFRSISDIWLTKHQFCTPIDPKKGKPMKIGNHQAAGQYITKYLQKDFKEWQHRMKCTRNLGMTKLKNLINQMNYKQVQALTWRAESSGLNHFLTTIHTCPLGLLRQEAKQKLYYLDYQLNQWDLKKLIENKQNVYTRMLSNVRAGQRPDRMPSAEFYDWVLQFLPDQKGYCEKLLIETHKIFSKVFPRIHYSKQHQTIGANNIETA